ncbi:Ornithine decarboxylase [Bertholletia excelsa]
MNTNLELVAGLSGPQILEIITSAPGVKGRKVTTLNNKEKDLMELIQSIISKEQLLKDPFFVLDLGEVASLLKRWTCNLPNVVPCYAIKCNPDPAILGALAALGASFDCASTAEIQTVMSLGVSPGRIIYANPCKAESHIKYAASVGVNLTTFDCVEEIHKIQKHHPRSALILRIKTTDGGAIRRLDSKYGAVLGEVEPLLVAAQAAGLPVCGVSFHVGTGITKVEVYSRAIAAAKRVFDMAARLGMPRMHLLDLGGGFSKGPLFDEAGKAVMSALHDYFGDELSDLTVIAEPGRYFAQSSFTLAANVIGKRARGEMREYWINDGVYGSMSSLQYGNSRVEPPLPLHSDNERATEKKIYRSCVYGPTCDSQDVVLKWHEMPELEVNDWLVFGNMGAYTIASASNFNGFARSAIKTYLAYSNSN